MKFRSLLACVTMATGLAVSAGMPAVADDATHRGGTLRLIAASAAGTLDPQINYTLDFWQMYVLTYDGLVTFKKVSGKSSNEVVADLADAVPTPTDGGKTYTFKLRQGVRFSNGNEVTTGDVVASFQRLFKVSNPNAGSWYNVIVGGDDCVKTPADCTLKGGVEADDSAHTVTFHLTAPDAEFLYKLATPFGSILPADAPPKDAGNTPIPGTGPYMFASYDPNKQLKLVRNPHFKVFSEDAQPDGYVDEIDYDYGLQDEDAVTAIENDQADWMLDQPPTDRLAEMGTKYANRVHINPLFAFYYVAMNNNLAPFNNEKARLAVAYALDRKATVNLFGGPRLAVENCQILPPGFPGYEPYCPFSKPPGTKWTAPDMEKARDLIKESGTAGQAVTLIASDKAADKAIGTYLQSLLRDLGYDASLKVIANNIQFTYIQNTNNKVQISLTNWYQDYPAPSDFLNVLFGCDNFHPASDASINIAGFCDKAIDAEIKQALALAVTDAAAANKLWAKIDKEITDHAPAATIFTPKYLDFLSTRVGNYTYSDQEHIIFSKVWVR